MKNEQLAKLANTYGTPSFVFDMDALKARLTAIRDILGSSIRLCYSIKANPFLIPYLEDQVNLIEVCSPGELTICERLSKGGLDLSKIIYSGVNKGAEDIRRAVGDKAGIYTAESIRQMHLLEEAAANEDRSIPVLLRLEANGQFGMSQEDIFYLIKERSSFPHLHIEGIHYFAGTQRKSRQCRQQCRELDRLCRLFAKVREDYGFTLQKLEYGPGLPVPFYAEDDFSDTLSPLREIKDKLLEVTSWADLTIEMGRFLVTQCGYYLTAVVDEKHTQDCYYAILDGGMNHVNYLGQVMGMKNPVIRHLTEHGEAEPNPVDKEWALCGSLCTTNDYLVRAYHAPKLSIGDVLAFCHIGAYSVTEGIYLFLSRDLPRILIYEQGEAHLIRDALDISYLNTPKDWEVK